MTDKEGKRVQKMKKKSGWEDKERLVYPLGEDDANGAEETERAVCWVREGQLTFLTPDCEHENAVISLVVQHAFAPLYFFLSYNAAMKHERRKHALFHLLGANACRLLGYEIS